jgi:hypothetical protein
VTQFSTLPVEPFLSFERGINRDAAVTLVDKGFYHDAQNVLLSSDTSARHPSTVKLDVELDDEIEWPTGNTVWFSPFTYSEFDEDEGVLSFNTHLLVHRDDGSYWRYDSPAEGATAGTSTLVRRHSEGSADQLHTHFIYDQWLCALNGRDAPLKYGQHLLWDGIGNTTPYLFPIGSKPISPLDPNVTGETITLGGSSDWILDADTPGGGARLGTHCLKVASSQNVVIQFDAARDYTAGPKPYGGTDFDTDDSVAIQYLKLEGSGNVTLRFGNNAGTAHYEIELTSLTADGTWNTKTALRSTVTTTGAPNWNSIERVTIFNDDAAADVYVDDFYFLYADAPPAASVGTAHKDRIVLGGVPIAGANNDPALSTLFYSPASKPDEYPSTNQQIISGGSTSLARTNRITALREYGDAVIIGTQNAIFSWTIGTSGEPSRSVITTETGIDSPRAIVETPAGSLLFPWQRGFYILRQTGRAYVSEKIAPILNDIWLEEPWWTIGVRDERTKTIRFWFREKHSGDDNPTTTTSGIVFDYVRAQELGESVWASRMTQRADFAVEAYVNGVRETLYCRFDGQDIYRMHILEGGALESYLVFPWLSLASRDKLVKWSGVTVPYAASAIVRVFIRYANNPGEFEQAKYEEVDSLPPSPNLSVQGRVNFGKTARWAQIKLQSQMYGFEIFPPVDFVATPTSRVP